MNFRFDKLCLIESAKLAVQFLILLLQGHFSDREGLCSADGSRLAGREIWAFLLALDFLNLIGDSTASTICVCGLECARLPELGQTPVALRGSDNPSCQLSNILLENGRQNLMFTLFTPGL